MHWLVPATRARKFKLALEDQGFRVVLKRGDSKVHLWVDDVEAGAPRGLPDTLPLADPGQCDLCGPRSAPPPTLKYAVYPPMLLFNSEPPAEALDTALKRERCTHAALNRPIPEADIVRRPNITPLKGDFGSLDPDAPFDAAFWATCKQNGIYQTWAPTHTMFSRGNVTEKKRVLEFGPCNGQVLDLYCGIGYFTFSYAKNGATVYGWELNRWSVEGLRRAALVNKWRIRVVQRTQVFEPHASDQIVVFNESNEHAPERLAMMEVHPLHINMGLLPDCRLAWKMAKQLAVKGTVVHVHENVHERELEEWTRELAEFGEVVHVERIKRFSPGVWHVCGDARVVSENDEGGVSQG